MSHCFRVFDVFSFVIVVEFIGINEMGDKSLSMSVFIVFSSVFNGVEFSFIGLVIGDSMLDCDGVTIGGLSGGAGGIYLCFTGCTNSWKLNIFLYSIFDQMVSLIVMN